MHPLPIMLAQAALPFPTDGWSIRTESMTIAGGAWLTGTNLTGESSALESGDYLLAIDGRPLTSGTLPPFPADLHAGQIIRCTV